MRPFSICAPRVVGSHHEGGVSASILTSATPFLTNRLWRRLTTTHGEGNVRSATSTATPTIDASLSSIQETNSSKATRKAAASSPSSSSPSPPPLKNHVLLRAEEVSDVFRMHSLSGFQWIDVCGASRRSHQVFHSSTSADGVERSVLEGNTRNFQLASAALESSSNPSGKEEELTQITGRKKPIGDGSSTKNSDKVRRRLFQPPTDLAFMKSVVPLLEADGVHRNLMKDAVRRILLPQCRIALEVPLEGQQQQQKQQAFQQQQACCFVCRFPTNPGSRSKSLSALNQSRSKKGNNNKNSERKKQVNSTLDSVTYLTSRLTVFIIPSSNTIITVHRVNIPIITKLRREWCGEVGSSSSFSSVSSKGGQRDGLGTANSTITARLRPQNHHSKKFLGYRSLDTPLHLLSVIVKACVDQFIQEAAQDTLRLDRFESDLFPLVGQHIGGSGSTNDEEGSGKALSQDSAVHQNSSTTGVGNDEEPLMKKNRLIGALPFSRLRHQINGGKTRRLLRRKNSVEALYSINRRASVYCRLLQPLGYAYAQAVNASMPSALISSSAALQSSSSTPSPSSLSGVPPSSDSPGTFDEQALDLIACGGKPPPLMRTELAGTSGGGGMGGGSGSGGSAATDQARFFQSAAAEAAQSSIGGGTFSSSSLLEHSPKMAAAESERKIMITDVLHQSKNALSVCEELREASNSLLSLHFQLSATELEDLVKIITLVSTIFIPLSCLTAVFGMNFVSMEGFFESKEGWLFCVSLMLLTACMTWFWVSMRLIT